MKSVWFYVEDSEKNHTRNRWHFTDSRVLERNTGISISGRCFQLGDSTNLLKREHVPEIPSLLCQSCLRNYFRYKKNYYQSMVDVNVEGILRFKKVFERDVALYEKFTEDYQKEEKLWSERLKDIQNKEKQFFDAYELSGDPEVIQKNITEGKVVPGACVEVLFLDQDNPEGFYIQPVYTDGTPLRPGMEINIEILKSNAVLGAALVNKKLNDVFSYKINGCEIECQVIKIWYEDWPIVKSDEDIKPHNRELDKKDIYEGLGASGDDRPFSDSTDIEGSKNLGFLARGYGGRGSEYGSPVNSDDYGDESNP